jgi:hypothetical protein
VWGGPVQIVFPGGLEECNHAAARRHNNHAVKRWLMIFSRYPEVLLLVITGNVDFLFEYVK